MKYAIGKIRLFCAVLPACHTCNDCLWPYYAQSDSIDFRYAFNDVTTDPGIGCIGRAQIVHVDDCVHYSTIVTCGTTRTVGCGSVVCITDCVRIYTDARFRHVTF